MSMRFLGIVATLGLAFATGCSSSTDPEDFAADYANYLGRVADRLASIQNTLDANTVAVEMDSLLNEGESLQTRAQALESEGKVSAETAAAMKTQSERVRQQVERLRGSGLITAELDRALGRLQQTHSTTQAYAKAGALPQAETPLDQAYLDLIATEQKIADVLNGIQDVAGAQRAIPQLQELAAARVPIFERLAELGADEPPGGIPAKFNNHYDAARKLQDQAAQGWYSGGQGQQIRETLVVAIEELDNPNVKWFRLSGALRRTGKDRIVLVELKNREGLQGELHQRMHQALKETAGATYAEALIEDDGTYKVALAPVADMQAFANKLALGTVSNLNPQERTMVLTLDQAKVATAVGAQSPTTGSPSGSPMPPMGQAGVRPGFPPSIPPEARPGFPPEARPGFPPGGTVNGGPDRDRELIRVTRDTFVSANGADKVIEIELKNARPYQGPRAAKIVTKIAQASKGRLLRPLPLRNGDMCLLFLSEADVNALATSLDLGTATVDEAERRIVIELDDAKVPQ